MNSTDSWKDNVTLDGIRNKPRSRYLRPKFFFGAFLATLLTLPVFPGIVYGVWKLLAPVGYWQRLITGAIDTFIAFVTLGCGFLLWAWIASKFER